MNGRIFPADRIIRRAEVAQLVEHATENRGVPSSILGLGTSSVVIRPTPPGAWTRDTGP